MTGPPPPGWYPEPGNPRRERWWDGVTWSPHTRTPAGARGPRAAAVTGAAILAGALLVATLLMWV